MQGSVGKASFEGDKLIENIKAFVDAVTRAKPTGAKGTYLQRVAISSTMGPGVKVDPSTLGNGLIRRRVGASLTPAAACTPLQALNLLRIGCGGTRSASSADFRSLKPLGMKALKSLCTGEVSARAP